jgi:putative selenium metabolism hydrolase
MRREAPVNAKRAAARIRDALDVDGLVAACQALVSIPSPPGEEGVAATAFARLLERLGYDRVIIDDKSNVIGWINGSRPGPTVMLNGHLDHVPPGDMPEPYGGRRVDATRWGEQGEAIYGRGSCDMKCNLVCGAYAGAALKQAEIDLPGTLILTADVKEELDSPDGVPHILASGVTADYGISLESTNLAVYLGHRGKVEFEMTVKGRTAHASAPDRGVNAVVGAARLIAAIEAHRQTLPRHPLLGAASLAVTDVHASPGQGLAVVPDRCTIRLDRRFVPGESPDGCRQELERLTAQLQADNPAYSYEIEQVNLYPLLWIPPNHPLVQRAQTARAAVLGDAGPLGAWQFGVNGTFMAQAGIPTVGFGPGDERWAHTSEEHVLIADLIRATATCAFMILTICTGSGDGA